MQSFFAVLSGLAAVASAFTTPTSQLPGDGLSIYKPGLQEQVPAGTPYQITWNPSTQSTVSIVLLRGPAINVQPLYAIVERAPNTGMFSWTPSTDLEGDVTHYGLQIIDDATGQYQWSTQFGIQNDSPSGGASHHNSGMPSMTPAVTPSATANSTVTDTVSLASATPASNASVSLISFTSKPASAPATTVTRSTASRSAASASGTPTPSGNAAASVAGSAAFGLVGGLLAVLAL